MPQDTPRPHWQPPSNNPPRPWAMAASTSACSALVPEMRPTLAHIGYYWVLVHLRHFAAQCRTLLPQYPGSLVAHGWGVELADSLKFSTAVHKLPSPRQDSAPCHPVRLPRSFPPPKSSDTRPAPSDLIAGIQRSSATLPTAHPVTCGMI